MKNLWYPRKNYRLFNRQGVFSYSILSIQWFFSVQNYVGSLRVDSLTETKRILEKLSQVNHSLQRSIGIADLL